MGLLDNIFDRDRKDDRKDDRAAAPRRADFSDVHGDAGTTAPAATAAPAARTYTVQAGDSLSRIAQRELGAADRWPAIFDANRDRISDPDLIHPGQVLTIPAR